MSKTRAAFGRNWVIPFAALIPLAAIVFAFSLGPTAEKHVYDFERHVGPAAERQAALDAAGHRAWEVLLGQVARPSFAHRDEALEFLAKRRVDGVHGVLRQIASNTTEAPEMRVLARTLLEREPVAAR